MSTSAILWMIFFLVVIWGGLVVLAYIAMTRDKKQRSDRTAEDR